MASIIKVDTIQTAAGGTPTAADLGINTTGNVLQVVEGRLTTAVETTSTSFTDTGLSVSITPTSASSKILITVSVNSISASNGTGVHVRTRRGSTDIINNTQPSQACNDAWFCGGGASTDSNRQRASGTISLLDSPATTSEITYVTQFRCTDGGSTAYINRLGITAGNGSVSTITLMEIAG